MSQTSDQNNGSQARMPTAPYPPLRSIIRSSLSSSPHYSLGPRMPGESQHGGDSTAVGQGNVSANLNESLARGRSQSLGGEGGASIADHKSAGSRTIHPSLVQFCTSKHDLYACINCVLDDGITVAEEPPPTTTANTTATTSLGRLKKLGPVLLEIRRLQLVTDLSARQQGQLFTSSTVGISRGNPQLGSSVASTCLSFQPTSPSFDVSTSDKILPCATGLTTGALCVHTFTQDEEPMLSSCVDYFTPRHHRHASAVAWRPRDVQHVAIGLVGSSGLAGTTGTGSGGRRAGGSSQTGGGGGGGGGDREFCCLLWDVEAQSHRGTAMTPVSKFSHNAGVASLAWIMDGQTLAVGCQVRNIQLYDLRMPGTSGPPVSTWAHSESVNGIEADPHRSHVFASFGSTTGEPVKLWDARRMDSSISEIKITSLNHPSESAENHSMMNAGSVPSTLGNEWRPTASAIMWSYLYPGTLSVAVGATIQHYDTLTTSSRPVLTRINHAPKPIFAMALQPFAKAPPATSEASRDGMSEENSNQDAVNADPPSSHLLLAELYQHRMLAVLSDRTVRDMPKHTAAPLAISRRDGRLAHALGRTIWIGSSTNGPAAMEKSPLVEGDDISAVMMHRARCVNTSRYSMDAASNIRLLKDEHPHDKSGILLDGDMTSATGALLRLWSWIERIETICNESDDSRRDYDVPIWPAKGLVDAGLWQLLGMDYPSISDDLVDESVTFSESLGCKIYDSPPRRAALVSCGWTVQFKLEDILAKCELKGEYERSAALAIWHDNIAAAVEVLQRGADAMRTILKESDSSGVEGYHSSRYAETLQLVSMCVAGYRGADSRTISSSLWRNACLSLLQRDDLIGERKKMFHVAYLRGICTFLVNIGVEGGLNSVLYDENLSLCDRVAFACRFLEHRELRNYLSDCIRSCLGNSNIEGLVVTGLGKRGFEILQAYVDRTADVQTAALVCSRVILPGEWKAERTVTSEWLDSYRGLLNTWQMWQSRALFDVDRAELVRKLKGKQSSSSTLTQSAAPAQMEARCNYCSMPLSGLRRQDAGTANQWLSKLSKMKPVLSCCPRCRKPLPRCSICLLSLGCLNPYMEWTKERTANLPLAEWFTWCMRCKHGGHAHHLVGWFASHKVCPVSGCDCRCQFDGIQKLNRPRLPEPES